MSIIAHGFKIQSNHLNWRWNNNLSLTEEEFELILSYGIDAVNHFLKAANCPNKFRFYVDGLLGISEGKFEFEITNADLIRRVRVTEQPTSDNADKLWFRYLRRTYEEWQMRNGFNFVERIKGRGRRKKSTSSGLKYIGYPSKYRFHLLNHIRTIIQEARSSPRWNTEPLLAIELAAHDEVERLLLKPRLVSSNNHSSNFWFVNCGSFLKSAEGYLDAAINSIPANGKLYGKYEQRVRDIEQKVLRLKSHLQ